MNKCPWCETEISDIWEYNLEDCDIRDCECGSCGKKISIGLNISYDYTILRSGCEHHTLDMHDYYKMFNSGPIHFQCTNCHKNFYDWELPGGKHASLEAGQFEFVAEAIKVAKQNGLLK